MWVEGEMDVVEDEMEVDERYTLMPSTRQKNQVS